MPVIPVNRRQLGLFASGVVAGILGGGVWSALRPLPYAKENVRAFGAKGDGVHDDTAALQRAIDHGGDVLWFSAGRYRVTGPLRPRSGQAWHGDGAAVSVLTYDVEAKQAPYNMVQAATDAPLSGFSVRDMGFVGGRSRQLVPSRSGQEGFGFYLRTELSDIAFRDCRIEHFGDGRNGGGGMVLGPRPERIGGVADIVVEGCTFTDNGNVPGLYICTGGRSETACGGIRIRGNSFGGCVGSTKFQNSIYVLGGGAQAVIRHVEIGANRFEYTTAVDVAVELNWVDSFSISSNTLQFAAAIPGSAAILVRDGCGNGVITGNVITGVAGVTVKEPGLRGILALNFSHPGRINDLLIANNVISGLAGAIAADRGSVGVVISDNRISGDNGSTSFGIRVVDASDVRVTGNSITGMTEAITLGHGDQPDSGLSNVTVERNRFARCGGEGRPMIAVVAPSTGLAARDLVFRDNSGVASVSGSALYDPRLTAVTVSGT